MTAKPLALQSRLGERRETEPRPLGSGLALSYPDCLSV